MNDTIRTFDPMCYARMRTYNDLTGRDMAAAPVKRDAQGAMRCEKTDKGHWQIGFEWDQPRDILGLEVDFSDGSVLPADWHVEYWQYSWPNEQKDRRAGAHKGWLLTDDAFHGRWLAAYGEKTLTERGCAVVFDHMDVNEVMCLGPDYTQNLPLSDDYNAMFRRALKFRVVFEGEKAPKIAAIRLTGDARLKMDTCIAYNLSGKPMSVEGIWNGSLICGQGAISERAEISYWRTIGAKSDGDRTVLELSAGGVGFSVAAGDIENGVYMEDLGLLLAPESMGSDPAVIVRSLTEGKKSIFNRVVGHPEQTVQNAMREIPQMEKNMQPKYGRYVLMGWEGVRQKFALRYNGDIFANKIDQKVSARDTAKTRWAGNEIHFRIATGDPPARREGNDDAEQLMPDARVPVYVTRWQDREIDYCQTAFATLIKESVQPAREDEDIMVMCRIKMRNASQDKRTARLFVELYPGEALELNGTSLLAAGRVRPGDTSVVGWTVQPYPGRYLRASIQNNGRGRMRCVPFTAVGTTSLSMQPQFGFEGYDYNPVRQPPSSSAASAMLYEVELEPFETHMIDLILPYPSVSENEDLERLAARSFDKEMARVTAFWHAFAARGAKISLPDEEKLNDFAAAVPWHVTLTVMRDPRTGFYMVPAGTYGYGSCGNEASLQIRMLDYLGYHEDAEKYLETFIADQGVGSIDGNFKTHSGALVANNYGGYSDQLASVFAYNLDHGYILDCLVDHYLLTGNEQWLRRIAPTLIKACDYVFDEREGTKLHEDGGERVSFYGLMPHGHLEDNPEWRCWFAVNAHALKGILGAAQALEKIGHPDAARIMERGLAYRQDIRACAVHAMAKSPAVPTGNGGYMPHMPTQAEIRGRDWGWFREVAYGPLHLVTGGVFAPDEPVAAWILRDQEDNLFLSRDYGRAVDREKYWFSRGGMTIQSNLLFNDLIYLKRGESERAIRGLFNNFAQNLYRDVNCFSEHPITDFGKGFGPFFKTPDESQFITNLRNHLIREEGNALYLLQGAARGWFAAGKRLSFKHMATHFGPVSLDLTVSVDGARIDAALEADWREAPDEMVLFLRTPECSASRQALLNGAPLDPGAWQNEGLRFKAPAPKMFITILY